LRLRYRFFFISVEKMPSFLKCGVIGFSQPSFFFSRGLRIIDFLSIVS
jgi:hypothetical protein